MPSSALRMYNTHTRALLSVNVLSPLLPTLVVVWIHPSIHLSIYPSLLLCTVVAVGSRERRSTAMIIAVATYKPQFGSSIDPTTVVGGDPIDSHTHSLWAAAPPADITATAVAAGAAAIEGSSRVVL
jgi:hypothetical protein